MSRNCFARYTLQAGSLTHLDFSCRFWNPAFYPVLKDFGGNFRAAEKNVSQQDTSSRTNASVDWNRRVTKNQAARSAKMRRGHKPRRQADDQKQQRWDGSDQSPQEGSPGLDMSITVPWQVCATRTLNQQSSAPSRALPADATMEVRPSPTKLQFADTEGLRPSPTKLQFADTEGLRKERPADWPCTLKAVSHRRSASAHIRDVSCHPTHSNPLN